MKPSSAGFPRTFRLNDSREFNRVFESATFRRRNGPIRMMAAVNTMQSARVGMIVGKRVLRHAVDRNRTKRVIREVFRANRHTLPNADIVVQITSAMGDGALHGALLALFAELRNSVQ